MDILYIFGRWCVYLKRISPFIFEDAVPSDKFFDRIEEIEFFESNLRVKRKMLLCIVAPLKYGKSSLMQRYHEILGKYPDIISIYLNLKKIKCPIEYIVTVLRNYDMDLDEKYRASSHKGDLFPLFEEINNLLVREDRWLFLLFDEFHLLPEILRSEGFYRGFSDKLVFSFLRGIAEGTRISYVVCGSVIEPLMQALDVWGGRFQIIYLGPFREKDAVDMIKKLFAEGGMPIEEQYAKIIAEAAGYHPFYIQYMGHHIYMKGCTDRLAIRHAKQRLFEFLLPIFLDYLKRIRGMGMAYIDSIAKLVNKKPLTIDDRIALGDLVRVGILKPKNTGYEFVDPLFRRYMEQIIGGFEPAEVTIVGHWAERIVGNYLLRRGYIPYYSHDSRGAFDIYARVGNTDVGIQVRFSTCGEIYLSDEDKKRILLASKETGWKPIIALVSKQLKFFPEIKHGKYTESEGYTDILEAIKAHI